MKSFLGKIIGDRRIVGGLILIIQMCLFIWLLNNIFLIFPWVDVACTILSLCIVVWIVRKNDNPSYKIPWIILILIFPLFGGLFYLMWGNTPLNRSRASHKFEPITPDFSQHKSTPAKNRLISGMPRQ